MNSPHEFANSQRSVAVQFVEDRRDQDGDPATQTATFQYQTEKPVRDFFNLSNGVVAILANGIQPFVNFRVMVGNEQFVNYAWSFGLRIEL